MRIIALDVHRSFAQMAILENGTIRDAGKINLERIASWMSSKNLERRTATLRAGSVSIALTVDVAESRTITTGAVQTPPI